MEKLRPRFMQVLIVIVFSFVWAFAAQAKTKKRQQIDFASLNLNVERERERGLQLVQQGGPYSRGGYSSDSLDIKDDFSIPSGAYISTNLGGVSYTDAYNIDGQYAFGGTVGQKISSQLSVEFGLQYSFHIVKEDYWRRSNRLYTELDQYNFMGMIKYSPFVFMRRFSPYIGGVAGYTRRVYSDLEKRTRSTRRNSYRDFKRESFVDFKDSVITNSMDMGVAVGINLDLGRGIFIGTEVKYMRNFINRDNAKYLYRNIAANVSPVEDLSYSIIGANLQFHF